MSKPRPVNLNLMTIRFPVTAIVSILHRISGVIIFFCLPLFLYAFDRSLASAESFQQLSTCMSSVPAKCIILAALTAVAYHFLAGVRHIIMDLGFGESLCAAKWSAYLLFVFTIVGAIALGVWLW